MGVKLTSKIGMAAATSLAGLAMMGAGSFALFTAHAASNTQDFAAGVVDVNVAGQGFQSFSDDHTIDFWNMVPGDYAGGYVVLENTGSVNEIINVHNHAHGPIFWNDGLNNGEVTTLTGFKDGSLPSSASPVASTASGVYANYWQPRLLAGGPTVTTAGGTSGWESVDYPATGNNTAYALDNNPATYDVSYGIYSSFTNASFNAATGTTTVDGTMATNTVSAPVTYRYRESGYASSTNKPFNWTTAAPVTGSAVSNVHGSTHLNGIVLEPGQYLVLTYTGQLPVSAHNDYQDAWGSLNVTFDAAQYENNHGDAQNPVLNGNPTTNVPGQVPTA